MTDTPSNVDDTLYQALSDQFDSEALVELSTAIAWENFRARGNRVFDVRSEGFYSGKTSRYEVCILQTSGVS
ncbi:hypothetical protein OAU50_05350 [Planctomycetota bacterium]|nr:hypothetical protein [Planctomycetota bacterium]